MGCSSSGINWKFIPYIPTMKVPGANNTVTTVKILTISSSLLLMDELYISRISVILLDNVSILAVT